MRSEKEKTGRNDSTCERSGRGAPGSKLR
jgi:hypothetical protein